MDNHGTSDTSLQPSGQARQSDSGRYRLREALSRSMSSRVYLVEAISDGSTAIAKQASSPEAAEHESAVLRRLEGSAAPRLIADEALDGRPLVVMERLTDRSLLDLVHAGAFTKDPSRLRGVLEGLAAALADLHERSVVHADLKPDHVFVSEDGRVRTVDFAAAVVDGSGPALTKDRAWASPGFAAPEVFTADAPVDARADVFAFGAVAFWAATGQVPPPLGDPQATREADARLRESGLPEDVRTLVLACLQPLAQNRPQGARQLLDALAGSASPSPAPAPQSDEEIEGHGVDEVPPTVLVRRRRVVASQPHGPAAAEREPRNRGGGGRVAAWLLVLLLVAGAAAAGVWQGKPVYDKHFKTTWTVDAAGNGDALSLSEAVERAGDDVTFLLAPGIYDGAVLKNGAYRVRPAESDADLPVILAGDTGCLRVADARVSLEGLIFRGTDNPTGSACIDQSGGELRLLGSTVEKVAGAGIVLRDGADGQIAESALISIGGDAVRAEGGGTLEILDTEFADAGGNAVTAKGGTELTMRRNQITGTVGTGIMLAQGTVARIEADLVQGSKASALEVASGARLQASDVTLAASGGAGVYLHGASRIVLVDSRISDNGLSGIFADGAESLEVRSSVIANNGEHGILSLGSRNGRITRNDIGLNGGYGLVLDPETRLEIGGNVLESNGAGALMDARKSKAGAKAGGAGEDATE